MLNQFYRPFALLPLILALIGSSAGCSKAARSDRHMTKADQYFIAGKFSEAEIEYINALRLDNKNSRAIERLGLIYYSSGRLGRAYPLLNRAAQEQPDNVELKLKLAELQATAGNASNAFNTALSTLEQDPKNGDAAILVAEAARDTNHVAQGITAIEQARASAGDTAPLLTALGVLQYRIGNTQAFHTLLTRAVSADANFTPAHGALASWHLGHKDVTNALASLEKATRTAPARSSFPLRYADLLGKTGQPDQARKVLTEITEKTPDYLPAWTALGELELSQNQLTNCAKVVSKARTLAPEDFNAALLSARLRLAQQDGDKAVSELEKLATDYPRAPKVHYFLATAYLLKGNDGAAAKALSQSLSLDPTSEEAILLQAQIDIRRDNINAAVASLTRLIERRPDLVQAHLLLVNAHVRNSDAQSALRQCEVLRRMFPNDPQVPMLTGSIHLQLKRNADARREFERAVALAPEAIQPFEQLVNLDLAENAKDTALTRIQEKIGQWPKSPVLPVLLARVHWLRSETNKAEAALQQAIALEPTYTAPYLLLAKLHIDAGQTEKAKEQLKTSIEKNPNDVGVLFQLGVIQSDSGDYKAAVQTYEKLLAINPKFSPALNNIAYVYSDKLKDLDQALSAARRARELSPRDPYVSDTLGWILYQRGDYSGALPLLQQSAEALGQDPEIQYHLGMAYYMLNQTDAAKATLQRAVSGDKDYAGKAEAQQRLSALTLDTSKADAPTIAAFEERLRQHPSDLVTLTKLGELYQRTGAATKAGELYETALRQNPRNAVLMKALALLYAGELKAPDKALNLLKEAYKLSPDDPQISAALGREVFRSGDHQWALSLLQQASQKLPRDASVLYDLAWVQLGVGRVANAETTMRAALADPQFPRGREAQEFAELTALVGATNVQSAAARVEQILKNRPDHLAALALKGMIHQQKGESSAAVETFENILKGYPGFVPATRELAKLYAAEAPDSAKANDFAVRARTAFPNDPEVAKALGMVSYARKDYPRAVSLLKESASKRSRDAELLFYLGMAQHNLKQRQESQDALRKALAMNLPKSLADEATKTLAETN